MKRTMFRERWH